CAWQATACRDCAQQYSAAPPQECRDLTCFAHRPHAVCAPADRRENADLYCHHLVHPRHEPSVELWGGARRVRLAWPPCVACGRACPWSSLSYLAAPPA